jgi:nucleoid DNA-binding protein
MANEKMTWVELRKAVAQMAGTSEQEAGVFLNAMIEGILAGLETDKQVKLKGIGTFALKPMAARKSVNIATGEEFVIDGYNKLTFNAESTLKENVEKRIETPIGNELVKELNSDPLKKLGEQADEIVDILADLGQAPDGVSKGQSASEQPAEEPAVEEEVKTEEPAVEEEVKAEEPVVEEEVKAEEPVVEEEVKAEEPVAEEEVEEAEEEPADEVPGKDKRGKHVWWILLLVGLLILGLYIRKNLPGKDVAPLEVHITLVSDSSYTDTLSIDSTQLITADSLLDSVMVACDSIRALVDSAMSDLEKAIAIDEYLDGLVSSDDYVEYEEPETDSINASAQTVTEPAPQTPKSSALADQPRYYYKFIGVERVAQNSRLAWISKKYYGEKAYWVFIYEANRSIIKDPAYIRAGQHLRIPVLDDKYKNLRDPEVRQLLDDLAEKYLKNH